MALTPQQEQEIFPLLDRALELPPSKAVLHPCSTKRANYLARIVQGFIYDNAFDSILIYPPTDPAYGLGNYASIHVEPCDKGLLLARLPSPPDTNTWRIIRCAATGESQALDCTPGTARQRLAQYRKKYPDIVGPLWVSTSDDPTTIHYAKRTAEEALIVDIDFEPDLPLRNPSAEETAKFRSTPRRPGWPPNKRGG